MHPRPPQLEAAPRTKEAMNNNREIPRFEIEDQERDFWASEDSTNYIDWHEAQPVSIPDLKASLTPGAARNRA